MTEIYTNPNPEHVGPVKLRCVVLAKVVRRPELTTTADAHIHVVAYDEHDVVPYPNGKYIQFVFTDDDKQEVGSINYGECRRCGALVRAPRQPGEVDEA